MCSFVRCFANVGCCMYGVVTVGEVGGPVVRDTFVLSVNARSIFIFL